MLQKSLPQLITNINIYFSFDYHYPYTFPPSQTQHFLLPTDLLSVEWEPYLGIPYSTPIMPQRLLVLLLRNKFKKCPFCRKSILNLSTVFRSAGFGFHVRRTFDSNLRAMRRTISLLLSHYRPLNHRASLLDAYSLPFRTL